MKTTINTIEAEELLLKYLKTEYLLNHSRESRAIMEALAVHYGEDKEFWGITGLLHDLDMDRCGSDYEGHGEKTIEILKEEGYDIPEMFQAILAHTEIMEKSPGKRVSRLDYCLAAGENITGLITAYVRLRPEKKIAGTKVKSIVKKLKDKKFAASVSREFIADITEHCGMERADFVQLSITAMESIADQIGM